jgi:hypothetical protein
MLIIPFSALLILFGLFSIVFTVFFFLNFRDVISSHAIDLSTVTITLLVVLSSLWVLSTGIAAVSDVDWRAPLISINLSGFGFNGSF